MNSDAPEPTKAQGNTDNASMQLSSAQPQHQLTIIDGSELKSLLSRPKLTDYAASLWTKRFFIWAHARSRALQSGQDTYLGRLWIFINPLLQVMVYGVLFGLILKTSRGMENFIGFLMIGVIFFSMIGKGFSQGSGLIQGSKSLIGAFSFPRAVLALSAVLKQLIDEIAPALVAILGALAFQPHHPPSFAILLSVPLFLLLHIFVLGIVFITARLTAFVPDLKSIISTFQRGLFYFSGIFYDLDRFANIPVLREVMLANPCYQFLHAVRVCVLEGRIPPASTWLYLICWSAGLAFIGFVFFWRSEERYANVK